MALTLTANWLKEMSRADVQIRFYLHLLTSGPFFDCTSGSFSSSSDLYHTPEAIRSIGQIGARIDPFTRRPDTNEVILVVDKNWFKPIILNYRLKKAITCYVYIGTSNLNMADMACFIKGTIEEIHIEADTVSFKIIDFLNAIKKTEIYQAYRNSHPLEVLYNAATSSGILNKCNVNTNDIVSATFNPEDAAYTTSYSHYVMGRDPFMFMDDSNKDDLNKILEQQSVSGNAVDLISQISQLFYGTVRFQEDGKISFKKFNFSESAVTIWDEDVIIPGSFKQISEDNICNNITIKIRGKPVDHGDGTLASEDHNLVVSDADSASAFSDPTDTTSGWYCKTTTCDFWDKPFNIANGETVVPANATWNVFCLTPNVCGISASTNASRRVSANRKAYYYTPWTVFTGSGGFERAYELVSATGQTIDTATAVYQTQSSGIGQLPAITGYTNSITQLTGITRQVATDGFGAVDPLDDRNEIYDVTILHDSACELLKRFGYGCPIIELRTLITQYSYQLGDIVSPIIPEFMDYGKDGLTASDRFEIIGKETDPFSTLPSIKWTLAYASQSHTPTYKWGGESVAVRGAFQVQPNGDSFQGHVPYGLTFTIKAGLVGTLSAGYATSSFGSFSLLEDKDFTFTASKDTYVFINFVFNSIFFVPVANGSTSSILQKRCVFLSKVVTNGSAITSISTTYVSGAITNIKELYPYVGNKLKAGSGPLTHVAQTTGYLDNLTSVSVRAFDDITDGTNYKKLIGVTATNTLSGEEDRGGNLISNSAFGIYEDVSHTPNGWEQYDSAWGSGALADVYIDIATATKIGYASIKFNATTPAAYPKILTTNYIAVSEGFAYSAMCWVQAHSVAAGNNVQLCVLWFDSSKTYISNDYVFSGLVTAIDTWEEKSGIVVAPSTARYAKVFVGKVNTAFTANFNYVELKKMSRSFSAYRNIAVMTLSKSAYKAIEFNDHNHTYGMSVNTATGIWTVPATGLYSMNGHAKLTATAGGAFNGDLDFYIAIYKSTTRIRRGQHVRTFSGDTQVVEMSVSCVEYLTAGDTIGVRVYTDNNNTDEVQYGSDVTYFNCYQII